MAGSGAGMVAAARVVVAGRIRAVAIPPEDTDGHTGGDQCRTQHCSHDTLLTVVLPVMTVTVTVIVAVTLMAVAVTPHGRGGREAGRRADVPPPPW